MSTPAYLRTSWNREYIDRFFDSSTASAAAVSSSYRIPFMKYSIQSISFVRFANCFGRTPQSKSARISRTTHLSTPPREVR